MPEKQKRAVVVATAKQTGMSALMSGGDSTKPMYVAKDEAGAKAYLDTKEEEKREEYKRYLEKKRQEKIDGGGTPTEDDDDCPIICRVNSLTLSVGTISYFVILVDSEL